MTQVLIRHKTNKPSYDDLSKVFNHHRTALDVLCRRILCVKPGPARDRKVKRLEQDAEEALDGIIDVAEVLSQSEADRLEDVRLKARVLEALISADEGTVVDRLTRSLCNDLKS